MSSYDYGNGISAVDAHYCGRALRVAVHLVVEDGHAAIVDTAHNAAAPGVLAALAERGVAPEAVDLVVLTHVHLLSEPPTRAWLSAPQEPEHSPDLFSWPLPAP